LGQAADGRKSPSKGMSYSRPSGVLAEDLVRHHLPHDKDVTRLSEMPAGVTARSISEASKMFRKTSHTATIVSPDSVSNVLSSDGTGLGSH